MYLVEIVTLLALVQFLAFGAQVGRAREKYGIKAPAVAGNENFERVYRVQMNTLEVLVIFMPALWIAAQYVSPLIASGIGVVYLVGRLIYYQTYTSNPAKRSLGFVLSIGPAMILVVIGMIGAIVRALG